MLFVRQVSETLKDLLKKIKPYLRWLIIGLTLFFLLAALRSHWQEVSKIRLGLDDWGLIGIAIAITTIAHIWSAVVWGGILKLFHVDIPLLAATRIYVRTNLAKYLPGNVWHFYGRMTKVVESGSSWGVASLSVLLEPLLLAAGAVMIAILGLGVNLAEIAAMPALKWLIPLGLMAVLTGIHPKFFNPVIQKVSKGKTKDHAPVFLKVYPWQPLLGEIGYVLLRGVGFLLIWQAIAPLEIAQIPALLGIYSGAWLAGFIVPGAPGGIGVFETVAIILLETIGQTGVAEGNLLIIVAILRLVSTISELLPFAFLGWRSPQMQPSLEGHEVAEDIAEQ
ncbi:hypothetical protein Lepto7376_3169 [[Leptolyngbya] sp. PCC 7376]|uniref:hypothetical protein n=1 Tax=[Leptolyngbya] sp. PCC 7376 TaxID=111781 RepID=UPI00029F0289|nr:hypothetical protein [[Leptolyngbya] sp. PCC 7376]AFY39398.1 hypothetical protein Lepto7376_3169 [[Leptolyngbya] sp. PCC 7376]